MMPCTSYIVWRSCRIESIIWMAAVTRRSPSNTLAEKLLLFGLLREVAVPTDYCASSYPQPLENAVFLGKSTEVLFVRCPCTMGLPVAIREDGLVNDTERTPWGYMDMQAVAT